MSRRTLAPLVALALAALAGACGSESEGGGDRPAAAEQRSRLNGADRPSAAQFPQPRRGESINELATRLRPVAEAQLGLATTVFTQGHSRVAFGVIGADDRFVYGPTALYHARGDGQVVGPVPAPADLLVTEPAFRSRQAASESDPFSAVYAATVDLPEAGRRRVLAVTRTPRGVVAGGATIPVLTEDQDPMPAVGEPAPRVETDTVAAAGGDLAAIDTRLPPAPELHEASFAEVAGRKPVALLFATPQLCQSRVCGPVTDVLLQLRERYGDRVTFIHQEVYVDNDPSKGLRPPLRRFRLPTEPWLFTVGADGRVAARLEGSFGLDAVERALQAAVARSPQ
jgi:hypothetical protein